MRNHEAYREPFRFLQDETTEIYAVRTTFKNQVWRFFFDEALRVNSPRRLPWFFYPTHRGKIWIFTNDLYCHDLRPEDVSPLSTVKLWKHRQPGHSKDASDAYAATRVRTTYARVGVHIALARAHIPWAHASLTVRSP